MNGGGKSVVFTVILAGNILNDDNTQTYLGACQTLVTSYIFLGTFVDSVADIKTCKVYSRVTSLGRHRPTVAAKKVNTFSL